VYDTIAIILLACGALAALFILPFVLALLAEALPLIVAVVLGLMIYGWLT
jgi:hypothetical protein